MTPVPGRLAAARLVVAISTIAAAGGCGTEPSDAGPAVYRLAGADNTVSGTVECFASSWQYEGGGLVRHGDCDVALQSFEATLDTTVPMPELVLTARVLLQDGGATTWRVSLPATVQNNTVQYDFDRFVDPLTSEQVFIAPVAGTLVDGVLTLLMRVSSNNGLPDRTEYARLDPSVFVLTAMGTLPTPRPWRLATPGCGSRGRRRTTARRRIRRSRAAASINRSRSRPAGAPGRLRTIRSSPWPG